MKTKTAAEKAKAKTGQEAGIEAKVAATDNTIRLIDKSFSEIGQYVIDLYKKIFLNQSSFDITNFDELKYNNFYLNFLK